MNGERPRYWPFVGSGDWPASEWLKDLPPRADERYGVRVVNMLPSTYEAYVRVLHPVQGNGPISWREVAAAYGREDELNSTTIFHWLIRAPGVNPRKEFMFEMGAYPAPMTIEELKVILPALQPFTPSGVCHGLIWTGYGDIHFEEWPWVVLGPEPLNGVCCQMAQLRAKIADLMAMTFFPLYQLPNYIWPDDQRWIIASPYDAVSSYIACPAAAAETLLSTEGIETFVADLGDVVS